MMRDVRSHANVELSLFLEPVINFVVSHAKSIVYSDFAEFHFGVQVLLNQ